jgi:N-acetylmuramoyl-L-alanine amidase
MATTTAPKNGSKPQVRSWSEVRPARKTAIPEGLWLRCQNCSKMIYRRHLEEQIACVRGRRGGGGGRGAFVHVPPAPSAAAAAPASASHCDAYQRDFTRCLRENKSDIIGGLDLNTADKEVASILIDLTQRETANKSYQLADALVGAMHPRITKLAATHRFAGFRVLKAPDIPSVLIELGFVSNPADAKLLQSAEYRNMFIPSVLKGLDRYLEHHAQKK